MLDADDVFDDSSDKKKEVLTQGGVSDKGKNKLAARRRLEDMEERKALREQLGDDFYDDM